MRRSLIFIPGNNPGMIQNADVFLADGMIIDLEDSVAIEEKDAARQLVHEALSNIRFTHGEVFIRMNPYTSPFFHDDLAMILTLPIDTILLPKADQESVQALDALLTKAKSPIGIMVLIETAIGVEEVYSILRSSQRINGLLLGGEDLCVDYGCPRTKAGTEILYARQKVLNACKALKVTAIDTPFTDTVDREGLIQDAIFAKSLGFEGKSAINPRQIEDIQAVFTPSQKEVAYASKVLDARDLALEEGKGVFSIDGKMIDLPIIKRAEQTIALAKQIGMWDE